MKLENTEKEIINIEGQDFEVIHNFDCVHSFTKNIYVRSGTMPKGAIIVGHIHKEPHLNILSSGSMRLWMNGVMTTVTAPAIFEAPANSRKVLYTLEDCVFSNIHNTDKVTQEDLLEELIDTTPFEHDIVELTKQLITNKESICG